MVVDERERERCERLWDGVEWCEERLWDGAEEWKSTWCEERAVSPTPVQSLGPGPGGSGFSVGFSGSR
eukprot:5893809-Prymnesium_polylepis.1